MKLHTRQPREQPQRVTEQQHYDTQSICNLWRRQTFHQFYYSYCTMKGLRQILRASSTATKTNEWILVKAWVTRTLIASIKTTKLRYFGHIVRHNCIEKDIIQGTLSGKRTRGRPKTTWLGNVIQWTDMDLERELRATDNRSQWRRTNHGAVNPRTEDDWSQVTIHNPQHACTAAVYIPKVCYEDSSQVFQDGIKFSWPNGEVATAVNLPHTTIGFSLLLTWHRTPYNSDSGTAQLQQTSDYVFSELLTRHLYRSSIWPAGGDLYARETVSWHGMSHAAAATTTTTTTNW